MIGDKIDNSEISYRFLLKKIDSTIAKFGLTQTMGILDSLLRDEQQGTDPVYKLDLVAEFLVANCSMVFQLDKYQFFTCSIKEYRDARMIFYALCKRFTGCTAQFIAENIGVTKRTIDYHNKACKERLCTPMSYTEFVDSYEKIEQSTILFLTQLSKHE
ncbi:MAG: hypothetical protein WBA74_24660 [Cyclobacteriaceae bacterium]